MKTTISATIIIMVLICASICLGSSNGSANAADWTVLVYFSADNDLEQWGIIDFNELEAAGSTPQVNVVVQMDRHPDYDHSNGDWTDTRRYYVTHDTDPNLINSTRVDNPPLGELDMGNPQTLIDFVNWGIDNYPATHYAVVLWDHGDGWYKQTPVRNPLFKGVGIDQSTPDSNCLGVANGEFAYALAAIKSHLGRKIDLLGFDACLMQMWEVEDIASEYADYMVGSEEAENLEGWNHTLYLQALNANPSMSPEQLGAAVANASVDGSTLYTMSCVDLSRVATLSTAINAFACKLRSASTNGYYRLYIHDWRQQMLMSEAYLYLDHIDLYRFAQLINADTRLPADLQTAASGAMSAVTNAVAHNRYSTNPDYFWSHGVAIYYPFELQYFDTTYNRLPTASTNNWGFFISGSSGTITHGDANGDHAIDISDAVHLIAYIFGGGPAPVPVLAGDANCDSTVDISDAVHLIAYIFGGSPAPCGACI